MHPIDVDSAVMGGGLVLLTVGLLAVQTAVCIMGLVMLGIGVFLAWGEP